ncbi:hypothetical protein N1851_029122 [Merluccius polli]|uniref:Reverse transcriptase domain-containing protein n=1 Tax=Merluccius polli TaxID=89951 RepID=A0AA47NSX0_MERPO|nr:hypothetical protein N1851_029122 [Merluccius polli]
MLDPLPTKVLNKLFPTFGPAMLNIMNLPLLTGIVPFTFKTAVIQPRLKKPGLDPEVLSSYRTIANLPFLSKVLERIAANQTIDHLMMNNLFEPFQSGFRTFYSTETAVTRVGRSLVHCSLQSTCSLLVILFTATEFAFTVMPTTLKSTFLLDQMTPPRARRVNPARFLCQTSWCLVRPYVFFDQHVLPELHSFILETLLNSDHCYTQWLQTLIHAIISTLHYCNALFSGFTQTHYEKPPACARLLTRTRKLDHITPILSTFHWLPIIARSDLKVLLLTFKILHGLAPSYLKDRIIPYCPSRPPPLSSGADLSISKVKKKSAGNSLLFCRIPPTCEIREVDC